GSAYDANSQQPIIYLPVDHHTIELIASDGVLDSEPNYVNIDVIEPIEVKLEILQKSVSYSTNRPGNLIAVITLPQSVGADSIVEEPVLLCPSGTDLCIEAFSQNMQIDNNNVRCKAFFDKNDLLQLVNQKGWIDLTLIGRLSSGQYIHASDSIRIH
ncbi:MAG: hypothetical protein ACYSUK_07840, partial [Planctomycetota bacterium]